MELLLRRTGIAVAHIPYRGAAPAMTDLLSGQVQLKMDTYATANQHVAQGKLRALAFASRVRSTLMPDVPTVAEMDLPGYEGILWIGIVAPAGTPQPVIEKLAASVRRAVRTPELAERLARDGVDPVGGTPQAFASLITKRDRGVAEPGAVSQDHTRLTSTHRKAKRGRPDSEHFRIGSLVPYADISTHHNAGNLV